MDSAPMVTQEQMAEDIRRLGIGAGDLVFVHSSLKSIGRVEGGADTVIDAFLEVIGAQGTLGVPTNIHTSGPPRPLYDPATSPSEVGLISETLRRRPGAHRSLEPAESLAALGRDAEWLTERGHGGRYSPWGETAYGHGSPWEKLYQRDARIVLLGVGYNVLTLGHYVEAVYYQQLRARFPHVRGLPYSSIDWVPIARRMEEEGAVPMGRIGNAETRVIQAAAFVDTALARLEADPAAHLAGGTPCQRFMRQIEEGAQLWVGASKESLYDDGSSAVWARALALKQGDTTHVLVVCEEAGLSPGDVDRIRRAVRRECGIPTSAVSICCTHRHASPVSAWPPLRANSAYRASLAPRIAAAVGRALERLAPQTVYVGQSRLDGFVRNERGRLTDGRVFTIRRAIPSTWRWKSKAEVAGPAAPADETLGVIDFRDQQGKTTALLVNLNPHDLPDYYEQAGARVEAELGSDATVLITAGAMGDQDTPFEDLLFGKSMTWSAMGEHLGRVLAFEILKTRERADLMLSSELASSRATTNLTISPAHRECAPQIPRFYLPRSYYRDPERSEYEAEVQVIRIGDVWLAGVPGELFIRLALDIKRFMSQPHTYILGIHNGLLGYLPDVDAFHEDSYHDGPDVCVFQRGCGERIKDAVLQAYRELR